MTMHTNYFCGNEVSKYGQEHGYVDYRTLAKAFDAVLNNDIMSLTWGTLGEWEQVSGMIDNSELIEEAANELEEIENILADMEENNETNTDRYNDYLSDKATIENRITELEEEQDHEQEVFQWYIVSDSGAEILEKAEEIVYYNETLDMYLWGVTHFGTSWDYVLTNIKIEK